MENRIEVEAILPSNGWSKSLGLFLTHHKQSTWIYMKHYILK
uniref:Uncharacterized protein n=1 Tax=Rhizophora mucronata TaxID=61149 RepID=A0A2P2R3T8_RHIMU